MYKQESIVSTPFAPLFVHILVFLVNIVKFVIGKILIFIMAYIILYFRFRAVHRSFRPPKTSREPDAFQIIHRFSQPEKEFIYWLISQPNKDPKDPVEYKRLFHSPFCSIQCSINIIFFVSVGRRLLFRSSRVTRADRRSTSELH